MSDSTDNKQATKETPASQLTGRTFLCVVDETEEFAAALQFACRRAHNSNGRVALLYVIEPAEFQHWMAVGERMREEAREEAEEMLNVVASVVQKRMGHMPVLYIREGKLREEVVKLIEEEDGISLLVLGAASGTDGPGPLVSYLVEKMAGKLRVPVTIVPGSLSEEEIALIT
jgi:nucleotide-binding universal stress UspA family protein